LAQSDETAMNRPLPYPPPFQDSATLCAHLCISEGTLDNWVKQGILPPAKMLGGKRMWKWAEIEHLMNGEASITSEQNLVQRVYDATKKAVADG
jgi:predicted site-specific integrase-resolvase